MKNFLLVSFHVVYIVFLLLVIWLSFVWLRLTFIRFIVLNEFYIFCKV